MQIEKIDPTNRTIKIGSDERINLETPYGNYELGAVDSCLAEQRNELSVVARQVATIYGLATDVSMHKDEKGSWFPELMIQFWDKQLFDQGKKGTVMPSWGTAYQFLTPEELKAALDERVRNAMEEGKVPPPTHAK